MIAGVISIFCTYKFITHFRKLKNLKLGRNGDSEKTPDGMDIPEELSRRQDRLAAIVEAKEKIEQRAAERYAREKQEYEEKVAKRKAKTEKSGKKPRGRKPNLPEPGPRKKDQVNLTDEESRIMPTSSKGFEQAYNAQATVDVDTMIIVEAHISQSPNPNGNDSSLLLILKICLSGLYFNETPNSDRLLGLKNNLKIKYKRAGLLYALLNALKHSDLEGMSVYEAIKKQRNVIRRSGRKMKGKCIGTTLLTKGLEFDTVAILDAARFYLQHFFICTVVKGVIFALDGTLLDSLNDLAHSGNRVLMELHMPQHPLEAYQYFVEDGMATLVTRILLKEKRTPDIIEKAVDLFRKDYAGNWKVHTAMYGGIDEMLTRLEVTDFPKSI